MTKMEFETEIAAPPAEVFAAFSDFGGMPQRLDAVDKVELLTDGSAGVGTKFRETRTISGHTATETMEVSVFEPPQRMTLVCESHGAHYESIYTFTPTDAGTHVRLTMVVTPQTFLAKILGPIMRPMIRKMMTKCMNEDFAQQRQALEQPGGTAEPARASAE